MNLRTNTWSMVSLVWEGVRIMYRSSPRRAILMWLLVILIAIIPTILLVAQREIVNHLMDVLQPSGPELWTAGAIAIVAVYAVANTLEDLLTKMQFFMQDQIQDFIATDVSEALLRRVGEWQSLDLHENPELLDKLRLASIGASGYRNIAWIMVWFITGLFGVVPLILVLGTVAWWIPLVVSLAVVPGVWFDVLIPKYEWQARAKLAQQERTRDLYYQIVTMPEYARDLRLFNMIPQRISRWREVALPILESVNRVRFEFIKRVLGISLAAGLLIIAPLVFIMRSVANGESSIGDVVIVVGSLIALHSHLMGVASSGGQFTDAVTGMGHYRAFMAIPPRGLPGEDSLASLAPMQQSLRLEQLQFAYPGAERTVIDGLSVTLNAGERVAIVGSNGAGKTTLTRLITRLFDPQEGGILWDGELVTAFSPTALRNRIAVIPQDFARFPLTLRENIGLGRIDDPPGDVEIEQVLRDVGLDDLLTLNDSPLDTPLTKDLEAGTQLSGGQWQRIAIARAMVRAEQADVVIMDEPTAALDPHTEVDIARMMLDVAEGKTTIVISHRLGICTLVDRVLVMMDGRIIEDGAHAELLEQDGEYASMFRAQASWYR